MTNNYKTARIIMIISIILSTIVGNYRSISSETKEVFQIFEIGENKDGLCARNDLKDRYNDAINLLTLSTRYSIKHEAIESLDYTTQQINLAFNKNTSASVISELNTLNDKLTIAFDGSYSVLIDELKENDKKLARGLYDDFHSSANILSHSEYNQYAVEYNQMINSFPNNLLSLTNRAKTLPLFGE